MQLDGPGQSMADFLSAEMIQPWASALLAYGPILASSATELLCLWSSMAFEVAKVFE